MNIKIIEFERSYKEELINFILTIQNNEFNINIDRSDQVDLENIEANYLDSGGQFLIAVNKEKKIVGSVGLVRLDNGKSALKKMFVDKKYRNLKVGKQLLDNIIEKCLKNNISEVYLGTIDKFISAQFFYANNGFQEIDSKDLPYDFPKLDVDNRFYYRKITDIIQ